MHALAKPTAVISSTVHRVGVCKVVRDLDSDYYFSTMVCSLSLYAEVILLWCFCQSEGLVVGCADRRWCLCTASGHRLHGDVWLLSVLPLAALPLACLLHHLILVFYTCARITQRRRDKEELDRMHTANSMHDSRCSRYCFQIPPIFVVYKSSCTCIGILRIHQFQPKGSSGSGGSPGEEHEVPTVM